MIRNIWAVGRNYSEHAKELGNEVPTEPLIFLKSGSCVTTSSEIHFPSWATDIHHELELALEFGPDFSFRRFGLALDLTERTLQNKLKAKGQPWTLAKSFQGACPLSMLLPWPKGPETNDWQLQFFVGTELRQEGHLSQMIFNPETLRKYVLKRFPVCPGDLLLTGTPAGVGPLKAGDKLEGHLRTPSGQMILRVDWTCSQPPSEP